MIQCLREIELLTNEPFEEVNFLIERLRKQCQRILEEVVERREWAHAQGVF